MLHLRLHLSIFCISALLAATSLHAQTLNMEQDKLLNYQQQLEQQQTYLQQYQTALKNTETALAAANSPSSPEYAELEAAVNELQQTQAQFEIEPSDDNKARLKNAEFKHALAERKFKKANVQYFELQDQLKQLNQQIANTDTVIKKLSGDIAQQQLAVEQARNREALASKAREAEQQRRKAEAAQAEINRLQAQLDQQKQQQAAAEKAAAATKAITETKETTATTASGNTTEKKTGAILLHTKQQVDVENQRLNQLLTTPDKNKSDYNKILNIKTLFANGETGPAKAHTLRTLGYRQYKGSFELTGGDILLIVGFNRWRQSVPKTPTEVEYEVILDLSDIKNPRLVYYPVSLAR